MSDGSAEGRNFIESLKTVTHPNQLDGILPPEVIQALGGENTAVSRAKQLMLSLGSFVPGPEGKIGDEELGWMRERVFREINSDTDRQYGLDNPDTQLEAIRSVALGLGILARVEGFPRDWGNVYSTDWQFHQEIRRIYP